jgi:3-dehydroquinate dehydratase
MTLPDIWMIAHGQLVRPSTFVSQIMKGIWSIGCKRHKAVLLNAAGYTHTSVAILDAIKAITVPVFEVHLSDPHKREAFRHLSYVSMGAKAVFAGHGAKSYELALDAALQV